MKLPSGPLVATSFSSGVLGFFLLIVGFENIIKLTLPHVVLGMGTGCTGIFLLILSAITFWVSFK